MRITARVLVSALAVVSAGCPDGEDAPQCRDYEAPPSFDSAAPQVSFSRDVTPIFRQSCSFTSCHGAGTNNGVRLGEDPARVHGGLVNLPARRLPGMPYVTPGDPRESFLMRKIDGSHCVLDARCTRGSCGDSMPRNEELLPVETRDVVRRWIAQGAKND